MLEKKSFQTCGFIVGAIVFANAKDEFRRMLNQASQGLMSEWNSWITQRRTQFSSLYSDFLVLVYEFDQFLICDLDKPTYLHFIIHFKLHFVSWKDQRKNSEKTKPRKTRHKCLTEPENTMSWLVKNDITHVWIGMISSLVGSRIYWFATTPTPLGIPLTFI